MQLHKTVMILSIVYLDHFLLAIILQNPMTINATTNVEPRSNDTLNPRIQNKTYNKAKGL